MKPLGIVALLLLSLTMTAQNLQPIRFPVNSEEVIITADWHDYWGDRTRTNNNPVLTIHGDGRIRVSPPQGTNELTDSLSADELQDLLRFIVLEQRFFDMDYHALEGTGSVSISDAAETFLRVKTADGERQVNFYALAFYARLLPVADYPGLKFLAQLRAVETRLQRLVETVRANGSRPFWPPWRKLMHTSPVNCRGCQLFPVRTRSERCPQISPTARRWSFRANNLMAASRVSSLSSSTMTSPGNRACVTVSMLSRKPFSESLDRVPANLGVIGRGLRGCRGSNLS